MCCVLLLCRVLCAVGCCQAVGARAVSRDPRVVLAFGTVWRTYKWFELRVTDRHVFFFQGVTVPFQVEHQT